MKEEPWSGMLAEPGSLCTPVSSSRRLCEEAGDISGIRPTGCEAGLGWS